MSSVLATELLQAPPGGGDGRWYGVRSAIVRDNQDPDGLGRVRVTLPWAPDPSGAAYDAWARVATLFAGGDRGSWFLPDPGDEVLVAFEGGDPARPFVLGGLWNGASRPPETMGPGNDVKSIVSRNGVRVELHDSDGREQLKLETPGGQRVTLSDGPGKVLVEDAAGNSVALEAAGITVTASAKVTINASMVEVSAGQVTVNAGMSRFSGVVQADTVITNSVVSASYTPGAGNIW